MSAVPDEERPFKIGHSPVMMTYLVTFFVVWSIIFFAFTATLAANKTPLVLVPTVLLLLSLSLGFKSVRVAVLHDVERNQIVVRNYFTTVRLPKNEIRRFDRESEESASAILGRTVHLELRNGNTCQIELFTRPLLSRAAREHHESTFESLEAWGKRVR